MTFATTALAVLRFDVPVTPGADEARRWAAEELAKKVYQDAKPGLAASIVAWLKQAFADFLDGLGSLHGNAGLLLLLGIAVVVVLAAILVVRPRLNRRKAAAQGIFAGEAPLTAAAHRELAASAVARGDLATAVSEQFRAMVRGGEERDVCSPSPGRTAAEVAGELRRAFPPHGPALERAAEVFNAVRFGHAEATAGMYRDLAATDNAVAAAKPVYADGFSEQLAAP